VARLFEDLQSICRMYNLPVSGNKSQLIARVVPYLEGLANTVTMEANSDDDVVVEDSENI